MQILAICVYDISTLENSVPKRDLQVQVPKPTFSADSKAALKDTKEKLLSSTSIFSPSQAVAVKDDYLTNFESKTYFINEDVLSGNVKDDKVESEYYSMQKISNIHLAVIISDRKLHFDFDHASKYLFGNIARAYRKYEIDIKSEKPLAEIVNPFEDMIKNPIFYMQRNITSKEQELLNNANCILERMNRNIETMTRNLEALEEIPNRTDRIRKTSGKLVVRTEKLNSCCRM